MKRNFLFFHFYSSLCSGKRCRGKNQNVGAILQLQQLVTGMWGTTVHTKMTSGFSTRSLNALRSFPSQHVQDSLFFIFTSCSNLLLKQTCYFLFCKSEHLSCTMSSPDKEEIKGWNSFCLIPGWEGLERLLHFCISTSEELLQIV